MKELIKHFDKIVDGFEICEIIVPHVNTNTKVEAGISSINNFVIAKLNTKKIGIVHPPYSTH